eukprot:CAMPEP_0168752378 /NCGR_PEP_ID=MMETSP0724-20121128/18353_1 /TAXON_ID=265536 /ORGANISM="Amphiprora sp., Strain CCMP467" /LENGTH=357 /DNA_ID=CAMNT_0008800621 /DNA_START=31 /DNA_END=1104 /DNA_ORIENTATION=+
MASATDPHGWLPVGTQPGSVFCKIVNTSRETLNNQLAAVLAYQEDRGRYVVHLTLSQQQASLKPENVVKASYLEQIQGQYQGIVNHPDIKRQVDYYTNLVQQRTGLKWYYVAAGAAVLLLVAIYLVGFSRFFMLTSFVIMVALVAAPDFGAPMKTIAQNFPMRFRAMIREQVPVVGPRIADNQYLSLAVMGLLLAFFVNAMLPARSAAVTTAATTAPLDLSTTKPHVPGSSSSSSSLLEEYYRKGFQDGEAGREFGTSMPVPVDDEPEPEYTTTSSSNSYQDYPPPPPPQSSGGFSKLLDWSTMMSLMYLGQQGYTLGRTADGGWDAQLALANFQTMDMMRKGFLAFSLYRLVSKFL